MSQLGWWALLLTIVGLGALTLIFPTGTPVGRVVYVLWGAVPATIALWQYSYHHYELHRLAVNRSMFWLRNPESTWGMTATFDVQEASAFDTAAHAIDLALAEGDHRISDSPGEGLWQIAGLTVRLVADVAADPIAGEQRVLRLVVVRAPRAFRAWPGLIGGPVSTLIESLDCVLHASNRQLVVDIGFPGDNPYFGLFLNRVHQSAVTRVAIDYFEQRASERDLVRVRRDRVTIITQSPTAARELSVRFLALRRLRGS